jgi:hypothetical protein
LRHGSTGAPSTLADSSTWRRLARSQPAVTSSTAPSGATFCSVTIHAVSIAVVAATRRNAMSPTTSSAEVSGSLVHVSIDGGSITLGLARFRPAPSTM